MKIRQKSNILLLMLALCLSSLNAEALGSNQPIDILIKPKGTTSIGFLKSQPLDLDDLQGLETDVGELDQISDLNSSGGNGHKITASGKYYFYVNTTETNFQVTMETTPLVNEVKSKYKFLPYSLKIGETKYQIGGKDVCGKPAQGAEATFLPVTDHKGSKVVMDQTNLQRWQYFTIKATVDPTRISKADRFKGTMRITFTKQ